MSKARSKTRTAKRPNGAILKPFNPDDVRWLPDLCYYEDRAAIEFRDRAERNRALEALWKDRELFGMPRGYTDALTLIVPQAAVPLFRVRGLKFRTHKIVSRWLSQKQPT